MRDDTMDTEHASKVFRLQEGGDVEPLLAHAVKVLEAEQVIAVPTETIYGVAALAGSPAAVGAVYLLKRREASKPVALCVADVQDIDEWAKVTLPSQLLSKLLPGPVTAVFERTDKLNKDLNPGTSLVGIRIPEHDFVRALVRRAGPLALTSANLSSEPSALSIDEFSALWPGLGAIFDAGTLPSVRSGSSVIDFSTPGEYHVIRHGQDCDKTLALLTQWDLKPRPQPQEHDG